MVCDFLPQKNVQSYYKLLKLAKKFVREVAVGDKQYLKKSADRKTQNSKAGFCSAHRTDLCFATYRFSQIVFITSRRGCYVPPKKKRNFLAVHNIPFPSNLTHNLFFLFPKVFGI